MLFEFDFGTSLFELLLGSFSSILGNAFEDFRWSSFDELLGICKTETWSNFAHCLNDSDLVGTTVGDDDVEFSLLFDRFSNSSWTGNADRCGSGYAPSFFELFDECDSFQDGKFAEFFY